jgi:hypothetical protein
MRVINYAQARKDFNLPKAESEAGNLEYKGVYEVRGRPIHPITKREIDDLYLRFKGIQRPS